MGKYIKIVFFILIAVILWIALTAVDAGAIGVGIILSVFAFLDIVTGEFKENEKIIWLLIVLVAMIIGIVGIVFKKPYETSLSLEILFGLISTILTLSYIVAGRKRKIR